MRGKSSGIVGLDALRGLAILLVVFSHGFTQFVAYSQDAAVSTANLGVILFFFLSGVLMDRTYGKDRRLGPYIIRRSFRILPMYWASVAFLLVATTQWSARDGIINALFAAPVMHTERMSGVYWTLYIEVLFYALVPVLYWLGRWALATSTLLVVGAFAVLAAKGAPASWAPFYIVYCFAGLQIGLWSRGEMSATALIVSILVVTAGSSLLGVVSPYLGLAPLCAAGLIIASLRLNRPLPVIGFIGTVSYSWYLIHAPISAAVLPVLPLHGLLASLIASAMSLAVAVATYRLIEAPGIGVGKALTSMSDGLQYRVIPRL